MLEPSDFFEDQIKECNAQAARAVDKSDREFWRRLAQRWEESERLGRRVRFSQSGERPSPSIANAQRLQRTRFAAPRGWAERR